MAIQYLARTEDPELVGVGKAGSKRKASAAGNASTPKRSRGSFSYSQLQLLDRTNRVCLEITTSNPPAQTLRSSFIIDGNIFAQTPSALSVTEIRFKKTTCLVSDDSGIPTLMEET